MSLVAMLWAPTLRNDGTPAGDGARIMKFIAFARDAGGFAFWNPYRNGGYPLMADPEHFWLLSFLVDPASPHANLALNGAIFVLILLSAIPAWLIGRKLGLRPFWNVLFVVILSFSERLIWLQLSGRVAALLSHAALLLVIWNLLYRPIRPWNYVVLSVAIGVAFVTGAHFALVHCTLVLSCFLFNDGAPWRQPLRRSLSAVGRAALVSMAGFALSAAWSIPLLAHFAESRWITSALAYRPEAPDSLLPYARFFLPFVPANIEYVAFASLVLVPALLLARWARPEKVAPGGLGFTLIYIWGAAFVLMPVPLIGPAVQAVYRHLPFVSGVRWFAPFEEILRIVLVINALMIFQALERRHVAGLDRVTRLAIGVYLAAAAAFAVGQGLAGREPVTFAAGAGAAMLAAYFLFSGFGLHIAAVERATIAALGTVLAVLSIAAIASEIDWDYVPERPDRPIHATNQRDLPRLEALVRGDPDPYFRFISDDYSLLWFLDGEKRGTTAFSLFYPSSLVRTLDYLSPSHDTHQLRPHWVRLVHCGDFDQRALDLIGVKYIFCWLGGGAEEPRLPPNWQAVGRENGYALFRNAEYDGGIKIFCNWHTGALPWARDEVLAGFSAGAALVEPAAAEALAPPTDGCGDPRRSAHDVAVTEDRPGRMTLQVTSATPGILFVPDNYDGGWRGRVNGVAAPVVRIYGAYLGVPIAAGRSVVSLEYRDNYFPAGLATSVLATIGLCGYGIFARRRRATAGV